MKYCFFLAFSIEIFCFELFEKKYTSMGSTAKQRVQMDSEDGMAKHITFYS